MTTYIECKAQPMRIPATTKLCYIGMILVFENGKHLYNMTAKTKRLVKQHAMDDAITLRNDLLNQNNIKQSA